MSSSTVRVPLRGSAWTLLGEGQRTVQAGGQTLTVRTAEVLEQATPANRARRHLVVWRLYWIDGHLTGSDVRAKLAGAQARLLGRGDEGAALVLHTDAGSVEASHDALQAFLHANLSALNALLQQTRDQR